MWLSVFSKPGLTKNSWLLLPTSPGSSLHTTISLPTLGTPDIQNYRPINFYFWVPPSVWNGLLSLFPMFHHSCHYPFAQVPSISGLTSYRKSSLPQTICSLVQMTPCAPYNTLYTYYTIFKLPISKLSFSKATKSLRINFGFCNSELGAKMLNKKLLNEWMKQSQQLVVSLPLNMQWKG